MPLCTGENLDFGLVSKLCALKLLALIKRENET